MSIPITRFLHGELIRFKFRGACVMELILVRRIILCLHGGILATAVYYGTQAPFFSRLRNPPLAPFGKGGGPQDHGDFRLYFHEQCGGG